MTFTYDSFLRPSTNSDKNIIIQDPNGRVIHTINPYAVINTFVSNNLVKISLSSDRVITLNFLQADLAKQALNLLQNRITSLKVDTPKFIDKQVENYVESKIGENTAYQLVNLTNVTGITNYVPRWISATAISSTSSIYNFGDRVSIGSTSSRATLGVFGKAPYFDYNIDWDPYTNERFVDTPWRQGGYGMTTSALFIQGVVDGLKDRKPKPEFGVLGGEIHPVNLSPDPRPLVHISASGYGVPLLVENTTPRIISRQGTIPVSGSDTLVTHFKGPNAQFIWEDTDNTSSVFSRQLTLFRTGLGWEFSSFAYGKQATPYTHIAFQRSATTKTYIISATVNAGSTFLPVAAGEFYFAANNIPNAPVSANFASLYPSEDQTELSRQIKFSNLVGSQSVVPGMSLPLPGEFTEVNRRYFPNYVAPPRTGGTGPKFDNLFKPNTIVQDVIDNTVILSATPSYPILKTDLISFGNITANDTRAIGRWFIRLDGDGNVTGDSQNGNVAAGINIPSLKITKPLLRALYPGDTFNVIIPAGGVGIGAAGIPNYKLNVVGGAIFDSSIILQGTKLTTPLFKMTYGTPLQSNFNLMVGDQFGDSRWVPAGQVVGSGFTGTSSTELTIGTAGTYFKIKTQPYLSFTPGQVVVLYDELDALYPDAEYQEGFNKNRIIAEIDSYSFSSGTMSLVVLSARNVGSVSNTWNINLTGAVGPQGPAGFNQGTFSVTGNILPASDYTYNLGSPELRWDNIYVKDARVASQSLYLGDVKLSVMDDGQLNANNRAINRYNGTSSTPYTIGVVGTFLTLTVNKYLSYLQGESVKVQNRLKTNFEEDGYSEESIYGFFKATVDSYEPDSGYMDLVITYTDHVGFYSDVWLIDIDVDNLGFENSIQNLSSFYSLSGTSSTVMSLPQTGHYREMITQTKLGFVSGQTVIVYNELPNNYEEDLYSEGNGQYFIGRVDYYYPETGLLQLISEYSSGQGTFNEWVITVSSNPPQIEVTSSTLSQNLYLDGNGYDFIGINFDNVSLTCSVVDVVSDFISLDSTDTIQILADSDITIYTNSQLFLPSHTVLQQTSEVVNTFTQVTNSVVNYDFSTGQTWYHSNFLDNYTANFVNLPISNNRILRARIIISQGVTACVPTNLTIEGVTQSVKWKSGTYSVSSNNLDVIEFNFVRFNNAWQEVYGETNTFI